MRFLVLIAILLLPSCSAPKPEGAEPAPKAPIKAGGKSKPAPTIVTPSYPIVGKIALVNAKLRYVVIDFSLGRKPEPESRLNVYRQGQKVGEVKISDQTQENNAAADVVAGEVKVGDEVRGD